MSFPACWQMSPDKWREGDVALLEAAAARLGLVGVEKPAASFPGGAG